MARKPPGLGWLDAAVEVAVGQEGKAAAEQVHTGKTLHDLAKAVEGRDFRETC